MKTLKLAFAALLLFSGAARASDIQPTITKAAAYLASVQDADGLFPMLLCTEGSCRHDCSLGATAWVINTLSEEPPVTSGNVPELIDKAKKYFPGKQRPNGLWSYVPTPPCYPAPADLDDTSVFSSDLIMSKEPAPVDNLPLILSLQKPDGDFPTWTENISYISVDEPPDCMVQINILQYLSLRDKVPKKTCANALLHRIKKDFPACSRFYRSASFYDVLYLRAARMKGLECLTPGSLSTASPITPNWSPPADLPPQDLIFELLSRLYLGHCGPAEMAAVNSIAAQQRPDGSWPGFELYYYTEPGKFLSYRSDAVTTAYALRALWNWNAQCAAKAP